MVSGVERLVAVTPNGGGLPSFLSPTRAAEFRQCGLKFYFSAVERWRSPATEHTALGNVVHDVAEALYRLPAVERTRDTASELLTRLWSKWQAEPGHEQLLSAGSGAAIRARAEAALDGLFELEDPTVVLAEADGLEAWVSAPLYRAPVRGRVDRMTDDGIWRITDYKTGRVPAPRYVEKALAGLFTYAAALAASHPERRIPDEVELLYLLAPARIRRPVLRPYLLDHARALGETWGQIEQSHARSRWSVGPGPLCDWCPFTPACPVRNRQAPQPGTAASQALLSAAGLSRSGQAVPADAGLDPDLDAAEVAVSAAVVGSA